MKLLKLIFLISILKTSIFADRVQVEGFVERFYETVLNRDSEQVGLDYWSDNLMNGSEAGADIARGFIFSGEFKNRATTNDAYLYVLYRAFFDREPDRGGLNYWTNYLNSGKDRGFILDGFLYSNEFSNLCKKYGIEPTERNFNKNYNIFVDSSTGLIWQDNEDVNSIMKPWVNNFNAWKYDYYDTSGDTAISYCDNLSLAGYNDWRLATKDELSYLFNQKSKLSNIKEYANYWSSSQVEPYIIEGSGDSWADTSETAYIVNFDDGISYPDYKENENFIRCVR